MRIEQLSLSFTVTIDNQPRVNFYVECLHVSMDLQCLEMLESQFRFQAIPSNLNRSASKKNYHFPWSFGVQFQINIVFILVQLPDMYFWLFSKIHYLR